jgi:predicted secreted protein
MTLEEFEAMVAKDHKELSDWDTETARLEAADEAEQQKREQEMRETYERRIKALEAIQPSGDPIVDAQAFFAAIEIDPNEINAEDKKAYLHGDRKGILHYFKGVEKVAMRVPEAFSQSFKEFCKVFSRVARDIIDAAERKQLV